MIRRMSGSGSSLLLLLLGLALAGALACDPQKSEWGLGAIATMHTPPDDLGLGCGVQIPADPAAPARASCGFTAGVRALASLGIDEGIRAAIPIRHVVIVMKENRSFDHLLGRLHDQDRPDVEAEPASYSNPDTHGDPVFPFHATTTCIPHDPGHQSRAVVQSIADGRMDGFVVSAAETTGTDGTFVMSHYDPGDLPFDYWLATTFAIADRHFAPMASGTFGNRDFLLFASNAGVVDTGISFPAPNTPSIMQLLMNRGFTWGAFSEGSPMSGSLDWGAADPGVYSLADFYQTLAQGTLPSVSFVDGEDYVDDDHPFADLQTGEAWTRTLFEHAIVSPQWSSMAIIWTYDEAGGFADHVPPPIGCRAAPSTSPFTQMGPRVPLVVISPWARRAFASHVVRDHTAIVRFIETVFDLPALTARDANSDALLDMFDFSCGRDLSLPPAPAAGTGGCPNPPPLGAH
jgi:phospholipase C